MRGVVLDLDDTLVDHRGAVRAALDRWLPELGVDSTPETVTLWNEVQERHMVAWRERRVTFAEQRRRRLRDFLPQIRLPYAESQLDDIFAGYLRAYESSWRRFPDVDDALAALRAAGLITAVLTNGTIEQQRAKLVRSGLDGRVGPLFTVEDLGVAKPSPEAFRLTCERLGLESGHVVSVGDRYDLDVLPARAAGLRAIHLDRHDAGPHDEPDRLTTLAALPAALAG